MWTDHPVLFLSGGGLKVTAFLGALELTDSACFQEVYGVSAGAILACLLAAGLSIPVILKKVQDTQWSNLFFESFSLGRVFSGKAPLDSAALKKILAAWIWEAGVPPSATLAWMAASRQIRFGCFAVDLRAGTLTFFNSDNHPNARLLDVVMASAALPPVLDPVKIAGRTYVDSGIVNNAPLSLLRSRISPRKKLLALLVSSRSPVSSPPSALHTMTFLWLRANFLTQAEIFSADPATITLVQMPPSPETTHLFKVNREDMDLLVRQGRRVVVSHLLKTQLAGFCVFFVLVGCSSPQPRHSLSKKPHVFFSPGVSTSGWMAGLSDMFSEAVCRCKDAVRIFK